MDRIDALRASDQGRRPDPSAETVINGAPYVPRKVRRRRTSGAGRLIGMNTCATTARTWMSG
jgi:hypothetical protein